MARQTSKQLLALHALSAGITFAMGAGVLGLALFTKPAPASSHITSTTNTSQVATRPIPTPPKVNPPSPQPVPSPPASKPASTLAKASVQRGTPKIQPVVTPSPQSDVSGLAPTTPTPPPSGGSGAAIPQTTAGYTSLNWAGYLAVNGTFTSVSGSWTATSPAGNGSTTTADSTWIGIGGVTSGDLIQVGTQNIISANGQVSTSAFYEMLPDVSQPVPGMTVSAGDSMSASVTQISSGQWKVSITDNTTGQSYTNNFAYSSSLSSAEWIEEDPSFVSGRLIPFDNFHSASFAHGSTLMNGSSLSIAASTAQPITMVTRPGQIKAAPSALGIDGASFTVTP
jgi:hypothetical protein